MNKYIVTTDQYNEEIEIVYADRVYVTASGTLGFYRGGDEFDVGEPIVAYSPKAWDKVELVEEAEVEEAE